MRCFLNYFYKMKNQSQNPNLDLEAVDFNRHEEEEGRDNTATSPLTEEEYLIEVIDAISPTTMSDEWYEKNKRLVRGITDGFHDRHVRHGDMPPALARRSFEVFLSAIAKFGWR